MVTAGAAEIAGLGDKLGTLAVGRPADLIVLQKHHADPYDNVVGGLPVVGRPRDDRRQRHLSGDPTGSARSPRPTDHERVEAWGRQMLLDTCFGSPDDSPADGPPRRLAEMRQRLIGRHPAVGPIFA